MEQVVAIYRWRRSVVEGFFCRLFGGLFISSDPIPCEQWSTLKNSDFVQGDAAKFCW